jgi:hypothetical protein
MPNDARTDAPRECPILVDALKELFMPLTFREFALADRRFTPSKDFAVVVRK